LLTDCWLSNMRLVVKIFSAAKEFFTTDICSANTRLVVLWVLGNGMGLEGPRMTRIRRGRELVVQDVFRLDK